MIDIKKLEEELNNLPEDSIVMLETSAENSFETSMTSVKLLADKSDSGIILSASRPYVNLMNMYQRNDIDTSKMFVLDCITKNNNGDAKDDNVVFLENISDLTNISLSLNERMKTTNGKKFVFIDSITSMLIHNKPQVFARFVHSILTRMRVNGTGGVLISFEDKTDKEVRAKIAQLCDKVIKV